MRLMTGSVLGLLGLLAVGGLAGQEPQPVDGEREHVVRRGDTLWGLASRYLGNPFVWPRIHAVNARVVADPHWIYPDQVLVIPGSGERADASRLRPVEASRRPQGEPAAAPAPAAAAPAAAAPVAAMTVDHGRATARTVFYADPAAAAGAPPTVLTDASGGGPLVTRGEFYRAEYLEQPAALPIVGRVLRPVRDVDGTDEGLMSAHPRDDLYVAYVGPVAPAVGERFVVAEVGRRVPEAGVDVHVIDPRGVVRVVELESQAMRVHIEQQFGRVVRDQVLLPLESYPDFHGMEAGPIAGEYDLQGRIIEFVDQNPMPGKMSRSFITLGRIQGVQVGDIFEAYLPERRVQLREGFRRVEGELLPEESVAVLRVVRVTDLGATVVADQVMKPQLEPGLPVRRVRKMP
jgi:LysM repeat protein